MNLEGSAKNDIQRRTKKTIGHYSIGKDKFFKVVREIYWGRDLR